MTFSPRTKTLLAVFYFLFISFLFFLPGSVLPKEDWLSKIYFDKWVHVGFFTVLLFLWLWALMPGKRGAIWVLVTAILYGIAVEFIQDRFVPNRSFDLLDWAADSCGSIAGLWLWGRYIKK